jgi:AGCS family alanine or glycine:cation symporter
MLSYEAMSIFLQQCREWVWGPPLLIFLFGVGVYLTVILRGVQFRYLIYGLKLAFIPEEGADEQEGDVSRFEALMMSLAGAIGTGNIVGIATAITIGGLGSIFWMWVTAILGMSIKYAEAVLAVKYRITDKNGEMCGGPMYYIDQALGWKWLAVTFSVLAMAGIIGSGNLIQVNSIGDVVRDVWGISPWVTGVVLASVTGLVLIGGVHSIGRVTGIMVPGMAILYLAGGVTILYLHADQIPFAFAEIFRTAFTGQAATGGFIGSTAMLAVQMGMSRAVLTSEAGLGISSIAAAAAKTDSAVRQALVSMTGTFLSTVVICSMTGLVFAVTGVLGRLGPDGKLLNGAPMAVAAFGSNLPGGEYVATIGLILFAYSTAIGWAYYGEKCCEYLFGERSIWAYRVFYTLLIIPGTVLDLDIVWNFADTANGLMMIPNLIALLGVSGILITETRAFERGEAA